MPDIIIEPTDSAEDVLDVLWGYMQFPESWDRAYELTVRGRLLRTNLAATPNTEPVTVPAAWIKALLKGDSQRELQHGGEIRGRKGTTAGLVLLNLRFASTKTRAATINEAIEVLMGADETKQFSGFKFRPYRNKPEIHRAWKHMQSVAHLWAGYCWAQTEPAGFEPLSPTKRAEYILMHAVAHQQWATSSIAGSKPAIDPSVIWRVPPPPNCPDNILGELGDEVGPGIRALLPAHRSRKR
jgi:hypothetical protein